MAEQFFLTSNSSSRNPIIFGISVVDQRSPIIANSSTKVLKYNNRTNFMLKGHVGTITGINMGLYLHTFVY